MFRVGQKVVYIGPDFSDNPLVRKFGIIVPTPREIIYTIRAFAPRFIANGYLLNEIRNDPRHWPLDGFCETAIDAVYLRPLVERKTNISFAHEILRKATKRKPAVA